MTFPILHLIVPVLFLRLLKFDKKLVFLLSPFALLPDIDIITPLHRVLFHNLLFVIAVPIVASFILKRYLPFSLKKILFIALFLSCSHLILDIDTYGSAYLYPFSDQLYALPGEAHIILPPETPITALNENQMAFVFWQFMLVGIAYFILYIEAFSTKKDWKRLFTITGLMTMEKRGRK